MDALYLDGEPNYNVCCLTVGVIDALEVDHTLSLTQALKSLRGLDRAVRTLRDEAVFELENG